MSTDPKTPTSPVRRKKSGLQLPAVVGQAGVSAPRLGALVRLLYDTLRSRMVGALHDHDYPGITQTELLVFSAQGPEGARPIDLAQRCHMSKQAMNYVLTHMERSGYLERRGDADDDRLVHLTPLGRKVHRLLLTTIRDAHAQWAATVGLRRFNACLDVLQEIVVTEQALRGDTPPRIPARRRWTNGAAMRIKRGSDR